MPQLIGPNLRGSISKLGLCLTLGSAFAACGADGASTSVAIAGSFTGGPIPRYGYGRIAAYGADGLTVTAFRADGILAFSSPLRLPGASASRIHDVALAPDGRVAVTASAQDGDGRGVSVIALYAPDGTVTRIVRTSPFAPFELCFARDGTLWAVGRVHDASFVTVPGHDLIRRYDKEGKLLQSLLPLDELPAIAWLHPAQGSLMTPHGDGLSVMFPEVGVWIELGPGGEIQRRIASPAEVRGNVVGIGRLRDGSPVLQAIVRNKDGANGVENLCFRSKTGLWEPLDLDTTLRQALLLGGDENRGLAFWDKHRGALTWAAVE